MPDATYIQASQEQQKEQIIKYGIDSDFCSDLTMITVSNKRQKSQ